MFYCSSTRSSGVCQCPWIFVLKYQVDRQGLTTCSKWSLLSPWLYWCYCSLLFVFILRAHLSHGRPYEVLHTMYSFIYQVSLYDGRHPRRYVDDGVSQYVHGKIFFSLFAPRAIEGDGCDLGGEFCVGPNLVAAHGIGVEKST